MAIKKDQAKSTDTEAVINIDNGDLEAIKRLQELWKLKDVESTITFAIGILRLAEHNKRILIEPAGSETPVPVSPNATLLNEDPKDD